MTKVTMSGSYVGAKGITTVTDPATLTSLPCRGVDNGDGTSTLEVSANLEVGTLNVGDVDVASIAAGTNFIGRTGLTGFKISQTFTRPSDITAYSAGDAMSNSTSAPAIMSQDLSTFGAVAGKFFVITNGRIISSVKGSGLNGNIWIFQSSFTATNDNSEFSVDDTTAATGGIVVPCITSYTTALNSRAVSDPGWWEGQFGASSTTLYFALQANSGYTPASGEVFTVVMEGFLL